MRKDEPHALVTEQRRDLGDIPFEVFAVPRRGNVIAGVKTELGRVVAECGFGPEIDENLVAVFITVA